MGMGRGKVPTGGVIGFFCGHAHDAVDMENPQTPSAIPTKLSPVCDIQYVPSEGYLAKQAHHSPQPQFPEMHSCGLHTARAVGASVGVPVASASQQTSVHISCFHSGCSVPTLHC